MSNPDRIQVRISDMRPGAEQVGIFTLERLDGHPFPVVEAGAHVDVFLPSGLVRQYSLTLGSDEGRLVLAVLREPDGKGGSRELHALAVGDTLEISQPRNLFPLDIQAGPSILIAGGIGITPIVLMADHLRRAGREWELHYFCKSPSGYTFADELEAFGDGVHIHCRAEGAAPSIASIVGQASGNAHFYCCGPQRMLDDFIESTRSIASDRVHYERFAAQESAAREGGFWIDLTIAGKSLYVDPGRTILETLAEAGIEIEKSCEMGLCGTCEVRVLEGIPDHRDDYLSDRERAMNSKIMVCCSGAITPRLVLKL